ncbi:MAG: ABC transporter permease [Dehalococcoidales bacterium]|nr:MAG: ABC transporter permease [Dehalococcoidales bacterium]
MTELWDGFTKAIELIVSLDPEVMQIAGRSLAFAATSCVIAALISLPLGSIIHFNNFFGKRLLINVIQTLYSVPTVAVGLFVYVLLSRSGPLGGLGFLFSPPAIIIGQVLLVIPIITGLTITALSGVDRTVTDTAISLGASRFQAATLLTREARFAILAGLIMGFGRVISEVGLSLMVGGNISGFTRTLTTAISLETSKGELELALALGIILIAIALVVNITLNRLQQR